MKAQAPYELIVVDNGSADGTSAVLEQFRGRPGPVRLELLVLQEQPGFLPARRKLGPE
jgi:glycosyltransferase involved in cell wall biosynthesis